ncbi:MAG: guanine deaminase [Gammaproteobacteria bacterium]|jgi:guanine deaminase|nr:guanine deaminase [Gammaproteobacteria bacterium]
MSPLAEVPRPQRAHRGAILHFLSDPGSASTPGSYEYFEDGLLLVDKDRVVTVGPAATLLPGLSNSFEIVNHAGHLLLPGFIDTHIHYPQTDVIASGGQDVLEWLENYTFKVERQFGDPVHARAVAEFFLDELLRNGTTTALVFCTVHAASAEAFFQAAEQRNLRMIAGKVLMDRNCPADLRDTAESGDRDSRRLIAEWHGRERLLYAITPRFAPASSPEQLAAAGLLAREFPEVLIQSHVAENVAEVAWAQELFPDARSYLDIYDRYGLVRERSIYAHCIHFDAADRRRMAQSGAAAAFCPSSNLYLGSGLFDIAASDAAGMRFSIATDVGGGTSFSMLRTLGDAYKVSQSSGQHLSALRAFYLATRGAARALGLEGRIGSFTTGCEADFIALNLCTPALLARRMSSSSTLEEKLLILMTLGDDRTVSATYILGERVHADMAPAPPMPDNSPQ